MGYLRAETGSERGQNGKPCSSGGKADIAKRTPRMDGAALCASNGSALFTALPPLTSWQGISKKKEKKAYALSIKLKITDCGVVGVGVWPCGGLCGFPSC